MPPDTRSSLCAIWEDTKPSMCKDRRAAPHHRRPGRADGDPRFCRSLRGHAGLLIGPPTLLMGMSFPTCRRPAMPISPGWAAGSGSCSRPTLPAALLARCWLAGCSFRGWERPAPSRCSWGLAPFWPFPSPWGFAASSALGTGSVAGRSRDDGLIILSMPDAATLWARMHTTSPRQIVFAEDGAGLSVLKLDSADGTGPVGVFVNGLGQELDSVRQRSHRARRLALAHPSVANDSADDRTGLGRHGVCRGCQARGAAARFGGIIGAQL